MRALQKELDELRETRQREKEREARRAQEDEDELQILRDRCEKLEDERQNQQGMVCCSFLDSSNPRLIVFRRMQMLLSNSDLTCKA